MKGIVNFISEGGFYKNVGSDKAINDFNDAVDELLDDICVCVDVPSGEIQPSIVRSMTKKRIEIIRRGIVSHCPDIIIDLKPLLPSLIEYRQKYGPRKLLIYVRVNSLSPINDEKIHVNYPKTIEGISKGNLDKVYVQFIGCKKRCPFGQSNLDARQASYWMDNIEGPKSYEKNLLYSCVRFAYDGPFDKGKWTIVKDNLKNI